MMHYIKSTCLFILLALTKSSFAQIKATKLTNGAIPKNVHYTGHVVNAVRYTDNAGEHLVITTETGETATKGGESGDGRDAAIYAYHYNISNNNAPQLSWQTVDFVKDCPVDIEANFIPNTFAVTDLNKDGKAEIWLMYRTICRGDISPSNMKIIMHEGDKKYAVRGTNQVKLSEKEYEGGKYVFDEAFKNGPEAFRQYALQLWKKNLTQTWK
jgi:hypothetical protein